SSDPSSSSVVTVHLRMTFAFLAFIEWIADDLGLSSTEEDAELRRESLLTKLLLSSHHIDIAVVRIAKLLFVGFPRPAELLHDLLFRLLDRIDHAQIRIGQVLTKVSLIDQETFRVQRRIARQPLQQFDGTLY